MLKVLIFLVFFLIFIKGCANYPSIRATKIDKVYSDHFNSSSIISTPNKMVEFERKNHFHGAITYDEIKNKYGNYYKIFWSSGSKKPVKIRIMYRQLKTGPKKFKKDILVKDPKHKNVTKFHISNLDYLINGRITGWKISIIENDKIVSKYKSYLWKD